VVKEGVLRTPAEKRAGSIPAPTIIFHIPIEQLNISKRNSSDHDGVPTLHSDLNALFYSSICSASSTSASGAATTSSSTTSTSGSATTSGI